MKHSIRFLLQLTFAILFYSCQKEESTISSINIDVSSLSIKVYDTYKFSMSHTPENLPSPEYTWASSNNSIISVNDLGEIIAKSVGSATITASVLNSKLQSSCLVQVDPIVVTDITMGLKNVDIFIDQEQILTYNIGPINATNKSVSWQSSDTNIATIDSNGKVKGIAVGETKIVVRSSNNLSDTCFLNVLPIKATSISINKNSTSLEISDTEQLVASFVPSNTTNKNILWSSSNSTIADISSQGLLTGLNEGVTKITAQSIDGGFIANCDVTVRVKGLSLTKSVINMLPGQQELIHVKYSTSNAAYTHATWSSSNPLIATVIGDGDGTNSAQIIAHALGSATISVTSADGLKVANCDIVVKDIKDFISLTVVSQGSVIINGYVTGYVYSQITNLSPQSIELTSFYMYDGNTGSLIAYSTDPTKLGILIAGASTNLGRNVSSVYYPIFKWNFKWNGTSYQVQHQYKGPIYGIPKKGDKLNLITK